VELLRERLAERNLGLELTEAARAHIAHVGYDPDFGARPLKRVLQREISDPVALALLKGEFHEGDVIAVDANGDGELTFSAKKPVRLD
jgi:ATP-dependent Clp protease ATP-binding subunit ClpB